MERAAAIEKILVRVPNWIGDAVMCLPALDALKALYPEAAVTVMANKRVAPLFEHRPSVADIRVYDPGKAVRGVTKKIKYALMLRERGFDMAMLFQNAFEAAFIVFLAGIPERVGYARDLRSMLLTKPIKLTGEIKKKHQIFYYLSIVARLDGRDFFGETPTPEINITGAEHDKAVGFLRSKGFLLAPAPGARLIGVAPGASYGPAKRWPPEKFAETLDRLAKADDYNNAVVLIFGGKDDMDSAGELESLLKVRCLNLAGALPLRDSMALLALTSVFVTNDSGLMHAAAALGVPTVAVFGSTDPNLTGPIGKAVSVVKGDIECSPCFKRRCPAGHYDCLSTIEPTLVATEATRLMAEVSPGLRAVFIDRDGTLNVDTGYINNPDAIVLLPGAGEAIKLLKGAGFKVLIVTNQSGVGRGFITEGALKAVNARIIELLEREGASIDGLYFCPHLPTDGCGCRKPAPGMARRAAKEHGLELKGSYVIGDKSADVGLGRDIGAKAVLVLTGYGSDVYKKGECAPDFVADDVLEAARWILADMEKASTLKL